MIYKILKIQINTISASASFAARFTGLVAMLATIGFASCAYSAEDYQFEVNLQGGASSVAGGTSEDAYGIDVKYLFDLGRGHKPEYSILAEQEFLRRKSYVRLGFQDSSIDIKDSFRSRSDIRGLNTFAAEEPNLTSSDRQRSQEGIPPALAGLDFGNIAAQLSDIPALTAAEVETQLSALLSSQLSATNSLVFNGTTLRGVRQTDESTEIDREQLSFEALLVFAEKYILGLSVLQTDSPLEILKEYQVTGTSVGSINVQSIADRQLEINAGTFTPPLGSDQFNFATPIVVPDINSSQSFSIDTDLLSLTLGAYLGESSALTLTYEDSESDLKDARLELDYEEWALSYKTVIRPSGSDAIIVGNFGFSRRDFGDISSSYNNGVSADFDYYFNDRFSIGGVLTINSGSSIVDGGQIYNLTGQYFITDSIAVAGFFSFESIDPDDEDIDVENRESFGIRLTGRL